ncbi:mRNA-decapping enzyme-like protein [Tanacetum coccineum]
MALGGICQPTAYQPRHGVDGARIFWAAVMAPGQQPMVPSALKSYGTTLISKRPGEQAAMKLGHHASSNSVKSIQPYHNSTPTHLHSCVASSPALDNPSLHIPLYTSPTPGIPLHDTPDPLNSNNRVANLIKPLSFFTPTSSASPLMLQPSTSVPGAPLQPPRNAQHNHGIPLLQPFPPPTPPSSFTPGHTSSPNYGALSRGQVRDALLMLAQVAIFIDLK